jgi:hypothetical protein
MPLVRQGVLQVALVGRFGELHMCADTPVTDVAMDEVAVCHCCCVCLTAAARFLGTVFSRLWPPVVGVVWVGTLSHTSQAS